MGAQRFLTATVVGGVTLFAVGFLVYGLALANAYPVTVIDRETPLWLWLVLTQFVWAALLSVIQGFCDRRLLAFDRDRPGILLDDDAPHLGNVVHRAVRHGHRLRDRRCGHRLVAGKGRPESGVSLRCLAAVRLLSAHKR